MDVSVFHIVSYCEEHKRPLIEGERTLDAKHIIMCGLKNKSENSVDVFALCLQSSKVHGAPHEININLNFDNGVNNVISKCICSCKAGAGGKCKHVIAVLLYLNRVKLDNLQQLSCTDLTQGWGRIKTPSKDIYKDETMELYCHGKKKNHPYVKSQNSTDQSIEEYVMAHLIQGHPHSEAYLHYHGRKNENYENYESDDILRLSLIEAVVNYELECPDIIITLPDMDEHCAKFYKQKVCLTTKEAALIPCEKTMNQTDDLWKKQRSLRITGFVCYSLYTYSRNLQANWDAKLENIVKPTFKGNKSTVYGSTHEKIAKEQYELLFEKKVENLGLVVNSKMPWLGFSPDGIVWGDCLIEIKCPIIGKQLPAMEAIQTMKCFSGTYPYTFHLKKTHRYYGQVQLGMFLLGIKKCHFCCYSSYDNNCVVIEIPYDPEFTLQMIQVLKDVYFQRFLPFLVTKIMD